MHKETIGSDMPVVIKLYLFVVTIIVILFLKRAVLKTLGRTGCI